MAREAAELGQPEPPLLLLPSARLVLVELSEAVRLEVAARQLLLQARVPPLARVLLLALVAVLLLLVRLRSELPPEA